MLHNKNKVIAAWLLVSSLLLACWAVPPHCAEDRAPPSARDSGEYDFIVAGGGTAGAIVASRLSEKFHVLLLESGYRLYDDATLSAKFFTSLVTGSESIGSLIEGLNPVIKGIASLRESDKAILDAKGNVVGSLDTGIPGVMPHLQETPFMGLFQSLAESSHYYPTVPQIYSQKREIDYPRGNILGGSSGTNTMVYFRGSERDFNQWEHDLGLKGWGFNDVLPFFKKYENNQDVKDPEVHGFSGLINITIGQKHAPCPACDAWTKAALELGYPKIEDASNPKTTYGASDSWQQFVGENGRRSDSSAYIRHLDQKGKVCWNKPRTQCDPDQTLHVWTETYVTKVVFEGKRAYGVEYAKGEKGLDRTESPYKSRNAGEGVKHHKPYNKWDRIEVQKSTERLGAPVAKELAFDWNRVDEQYIPEVTRDFEAKTVSAKYEVILSTGAIGTAQLLMLSGIGPRDHLLERGIDILVDLPVGTRTQDHQEIISMWKHRDDFDPGFDFISETVKGFPTLRAHLRGERSFFSNNGVPAGLEGSSAGPKGTVPKWHLHHITMGALENLDFNIAAYPETVETPWRVPRSLLELYRWKGLKLHVHNCELSQNHAYGRIELRNEDPFVPPFVDPRYGSSEEDNAEMVHCLETVREIMKKSDPKFVGEELEPSKSAKTKEQLTQYVRNGVWGHHISGSAPMGNCSTSYTVTDRHARVHGVEGLRVADLSIVPTIPHGNPAGVAMMIGEKIADQILNDYKSAKTSASSKSTHDEL